MWSPEEKLFIDCLRSPLKTASFHSGQDKRIDWDNFMEQASRHGLSGLIYFYSRQADFKYTFPPNVNRFLKKEYYRNIVKNMLLLKELRRVFPALDNGGVKPLLLQGIALLFAQTYPSQGMRPLCDIDFLIEPDQRETVGQVLGKLGYTPIPNYPNLFSRKEVLLDIHTDVANLERIKARRYAVNLPNACLWQAACVKQGSWGTAYTLSIEDLIITSAAHLQKHSHSRLIWFVDIMHIIERYGTQLDWCKISARAKKFNLQKPLYFSLMFLQKVLNCKIAQGLTTGLLDEDLSLVEEKFLAGLISGAKFSRAGDFLYMCSIKTTKKKLLFLRETVFPRREVMQQIFGFSNPLAVGFCYLIRFFQSLWYGIRLLVPAK